MLADIVKQFFVIFSKSFRQEHLIAFELIMCLAVGHLFGCYNPKQFADYLGISFQSLYKTLKEWSPYYLKKMLLCFMIHQAVEELKPILEKSAATQSRAGISLSVDNSVIDRLGKMLRCTWSWYSGRWKKVLKGQDLLGIVLTINGTAFPLYLWFCSKQGSAHTDKPSLLLKMFSELKEAFEREGADLTQFPITMDSWFVSEELKQALYELGFTKIIIAGKGNYTFESAHKKQKASQWKKEVAYQKQQWGIDVPAIRLKMTSPTFGKVVLFFFQKNTTRNYYLMDFSLNPRRGAEIWHIWKQHHLIECFWKLLKSILQIKAMQLRDHGLYTALFIKILAFLILIKCKQIKAFSHSTMTQIMRKLRQNLDFKDWIDEHFHSNFSVTYDDYGLSAY
jgi:hypothetical protein